MNIVLIIFMSTPILITVNSIYNVRKSLKNRGMHFVDLVSNEECAKKVKEDTKNLIYINTLILILGLVLTFVAIVIQIL